MSNGGLLFLTQKSVQGLISWLRSWFDSIYELQTNKTSSWNNSPNNTRYPTEKLVKDSLDLKSDFGHGHTIEDITTRMYSASKIDELLVDVKGDTATDVMDKIGMMYALRNETTHDITGVITTYYQGIMEYGLSAILQDYIIDGVEGVYEIRGYRFPDLFYYYDGNNLTCLTPTKIELSCSDYNPNIDSTVVVTAKLTDMFGNPIPYENLTLEIQSEGGSSSVNLITDSNGVATYSYTCSSWGICRFSIKSFSCQVNVTGQKKVKEGSNWSGVTYTLYVDEANRNATLICNITNKNIASGNSNYEMTGWIPTEYRPHSQKFIQGYRGNNNLFYIFYDGRVGVANLTSSTQTNVTLGAQIDWNY